MDIEEEKEGLDFDIAKSIRYHAYRRSFWEAIDATFKILTIVSGTAVLVSFVAKWPVASESFAFIVAIASASDVVLGFSKKARDHDVLYRQFSLLRQTISDTQGVSEANIYAWRRKRLEIEMDEPFTLDLLERRCSRDEATARGLDVDPAWELEPWQVFISQWAFWPAH